MRPILQVASGFAATIAIFGAGAIFATAILAVDAKEEAKPALDMASTGVWTNDSVRVVSAAPTADDQPASKDVAEQNPADPAQLPSEDPLTTAALPVPPGDQPMSQDDPGTVAAHVDWCFDRYRSYNPSDNSYRSYSGELRDYQSPFIERGAVSADAAPMMDDASYVEAGLVPEDHIQACMSRYRSYDPHDNSFQPYDGGPRQQCQP